MKKAFFAGCIATALISTPASASDPGRYQLYAPNGPNSPSGLVLMIDTEKGEVWRMIDAVTWQKMGRKDESLPENKH